ncbi:ABC transporter permease [Oceanispirochaeta sp.]|jgi:ribose transport system permease protein|uniref:ABC transporter permease n=1 Tax=Oceanispirochaeta sp. TaxID=2035350 RepID=UPI002604532C|nr:ABC transporter permease [Oceanispirochaeta sp.]MDA3959056.1 ABC transporter permease [Oceanispirochaeta sp.]
MKNFLKNIKMGTANSEKKQIPSIYIALGMLVFFFLIFSIVNPSFFKRYNIMTIGTASVILLAVGLGQVFAILTGGIDLSVGGIMSLVSVVFMITLEPLGYGAYPVSLAAGLAAGFLNGFLNSKLRIPSFITTLGTGGIFISIAFMISEKPLSAPASRFDILELVNGSVGGVKNIMIIGLVIFALFFVIQKYTITGRHIMFLGSNEKMSWMSGLDIFKLRVVAFTLSGLGAGLAGIMLSATLYSGYSTLGTVYVLNSIATVVVGGTAMTGGAGGVLNTLVGALILSVLNNGMNVIGVDVYAQQSFLGVLIIIAVAISFDRKKLTVIK